MSDTRHTLLAYMVDEVSRDQVERFIASRGWQDQSEVHTGTIRDAVSYLKTHRSPLFLIVDIASVESTLADLNALADVCEPHVHVLVCGHVNEYSFYQAIIKLGVDHYLLKPFTQNDLDAIFSDVINRQQAQHASPAEPEEKNLVAVIGTRGGIGTSTVALNLASIAANDHQSKTILVDADMYFGSVALNMDLEPGHGMKEMVEQPDRVDGMFIDRIITRKHDNLFVLSAEEALDQDIQIKEDAAETMLMQLVEQFSIIVVDLPRQMNHMARTILAKATDVVIVTDYSIAGLRDSMRLADLFKSRLAANDDIRLLYVSNTTSPADKQGGMSKHDFEKNLGHTIHTVIPYEAKATAAANSGQVLVESERKSRIAVAIRHLADEIYHGESTIAPSLLTKLLHPGHN